MVIEEIITALLYVANMIIICILIIIYWKNYRKFNSSFAFGLMLFAAFLLLHNLIAMLSVIFLSDATANVNLILQHMYLIVPLIELIGLIILLKITWK